MKHTPGPWLVSSTFGEDLEIVTYSEGHRFFIATVEYADRASVEVANANLIAAAPALLEALDGMIQCIDAYHDTSRPIPSHLSAWYGAGRSAIAQAEGENSC